MRHHRHTGVVAGAALLAGAAVTALALRAGSGGDPAPATPPQPAAGAAPAPAATTPAPDLTWQVRDGVAVPTSRTAGPARTDGPLGVGFARTDLGAALAAVHVAWAASPAPGPATFRAALERQVTGDARDALQVAVERDYAEARARDHLPDGAPLPTADAVLTGWSAAALPGGDRHVQLLEQGADADGAPTLYAVDVVMTWRDGDWRLVAPADGTWDSVVTRLDVAPPGTTAFNPAAPGAVDPADGQGGT